MKDQIIESKGIMCIDNWFPWNFTQGSFHAFQGLSGNFLQIDIRNLSL